MRRLVFVVALAGCTHAAATGPAWPTSSAAEGGESLAPREQATTVAAVTPKDDAADEAAAPAPTTPAADPAPSESDESEAAATEPSDAEEPVTTEEIVIEVGPDD